MNWELRRICNTSKRVRDCSNARPLLTTVELLLDTIARQGKVAKRKSNTFRTPQFHFPDPPPTFLPVQTPNPGQFFFFYVQYTAIHLFRSQTHLQPNLCFQTKPPLCNDLFFFIFHAVKPPEIHLLPSHPAMGHCLHISTPHPRSTNNLPRGVLEPHAQELRCHWEEHGQGCF